MKAPSVRGEVEHCIVIADNYTCYGVTMHDKKNNKINENFLLHFRVSDDIWSI